MQTPTRGERRTIKFMILLGIFSILYFLFYFFQPHHTGNPWLFFLLSITILYSVLKKLYMWYNYSNLSIPETPELTTKFKVDVLTTYYPGEPYEMTTTTLKAIKKITYPHTTYLCDEANDPYLKQFCEDNDIVHVTRDNRINAKAGNINNALEKHATGDICVILDPDHIPKPNFLDPILPHFQDPEIGFVQIVQSYYNIKESLVAQGAAEQTFQFYGPMMMTLNSYGAVNAIGANCVFRRSALDSIGGHAPGLCEDMHTAMLLYSKGWKAVYVPEVLARGLAPSNLLGFFKQQLKWSRGTFDLLVKVYPRIFTKLTGRQKIHFGILPMHYFAGIISLINFLIPILALLFSITPWKGNIIEFALVLIPVATSAVLIRTYIQKWVIEKKERGFHIIGGLLHINSWWIYLVGFFYTIIDRKVPYLPTPKENEWNTNLTIVLPNAIVAIISIFAIIYGLNQDFTPFSLVMAGFAFFNACIMLFGIYLTLRITNRNRILRGTLRNRSLSFLSGIRQGFSVAANFTFTTTRFIALPLLLLLLIISMSLKQKKDLGRWEQVEAPVFEKVNNNYLGIFHPSGEGGLSNLQEINAIEENQDVDFDIISFYLAWNDDSIKNFPDELMAGIYEKNAIPMITWEPWGFGIAAGDTISELKEDKKALKYISEGYFDGYIKNFVDILKAYDEPVYLRFAHEFDNPQYPWSLAGNNTPEEFKAAWIHLYNILKEQGAHKIMMVWNPWKANSMADYYPGDGFVDWIGITLLNYGPLSGVGDYYSFEDLYLPFNEELKTFARKKPVMLAEFGSVQMGDKQEEWLIDAASSIESYEEIKATVIFNSAYDKNIPANNWYQNKYIDWTTNFIETVGNVFERSPVKENSQIKTYKFSAHSPNPLTKHDIKGVRFRKGEDWKQNYYALTKEELLKDFHLLKEVGVNTIQFTGGNIYEYNILSHAKDFDLNIIYQFRIMDNEGFLKNEQELKEMKEYILKKVQRLKNNENILGYSFNFELERYFDKPLLFYQQKAYVDWLRTVIPEIRDLDPKKSIIVDLNVDEETMVLLEKLNNGLPVDTYGLIVNDTTYLKQVKIFAKNKKLSTYISSLDPGLLSEGHQNLTEDMIIQNWQDERKSNWLSFDGLIDFNGDKKEVLKRIENNWTEGYKVLNETSIRILKPAKSIRPGKNAVYQALLYENNTWLNPYSSSFNYSFDWYLIKNDRYGNPLALRKLGSGPEIPVTIPEDYSGYSLMVIAKNTKDGYVISSRSILHTRLK